jgi:hypothetical protein
MCTAFCDSSVSPRCFVSMYHCVAAGWTNALQLLSVEGIVLLPNTSFGTHTAYGPMRTEGAFFEVKLSDREAHS